MLEYNRFNSIKTLLYSDRIWKIVEGGMPYPVIWHIYPTNRCQNNCTFCIMKKERKSGAELSEETLFKAVESAAKYEAKTIHFSGGGEPLLHPNIKEAISLAKSRGLKVALSTNGMLFTPDIAELVDYPRISLDASHSILHKAIKGSDSFSKVTGNISGMSAEVRKKIGLGFVLNNENCGDIYDFCALARDLGVGFVHIRPAYSPNVEYNEKLKSCLDACEESVKKGKEIFPDVYFVKEKFDGYWTPRCYEKCRATPLLAVLKANGRFIPCQDRIDLEFGNLNEDDFEAIWLGEEHRKIIEGIKLDECPRCVESKKNEYIQKMFVEDSLLRDML